MDNQLDRFNTINDLQQQQQQQLSISNAKVINSTDVHFGDKTIYEGPVVIKQYILVDDDEWLASELDDEGSNIVSGLRREEEGVDGAEMVDAVTCDENQVAGDFITADVIEDREIEITKDLADTCLSNSLVTINSSKNVHFGRKIQYKGPITVERLIYPKSKVDFYALESKLWLNESTDASAKYLSTISRIEWKAIPPINEPDLLIHPIPNIIINHTATAISTTRLECIYAIRSFQRFHVETRQWYDIGYNFLIGADGNVYDGRGWRKMGAHTKYYNHVSLGVAFIGNFSNVKASKQQVAAFWRLMREGVRKGYVSRKYKIFAARQLRPTESPGAALYQQMKSWPGWYRTLEITEL